MYEWSFCTNKIAIQGQNNKYHEPKNSGTLLHVDSRNLIGRLRTWSNICKNWAPFGNTKHITVHNCQNITHFLSPGALWDTLRFSGTEPKRFSQCHMHYICGLGGKVYFSFFIQNDKSHKIYFQYYPIPSTNQYIKMNGSSV